MTQQFRDIAPVRTYTGHYNDYHKYKPFLADDFNHHCGYTHCVDKWFGGQRTFQIDHFKPHSLFPNLKTDYSNLVYCCSYVNRLKSDKVDEKYLDPCEEDYNEHFERDENGFIVGKTIQGKFMVKELCLSLCRYAYIWNLERLEKRIEKVKLKIGKHPELKEVYYEMLEAHFNYQQSLFINQ